MSADQKQQNQCIIIMISGPTQQYRNFFSKKSKESFLIFFLRFSHFFLRYIIFGKTKKLLNYTRNDLRCFRTLEINSKR